MVVMRGKTYEDIKEKATGGVASTTNKKETSTIVPENNVDTQPTPA